MKISFHGAAGGVTGCCHLLQTSRARILLDFGLHQGGPDEEAWNRRRPAFDAHSLDAVVLSHAHIDHCGRLPLLPLMGFRGSVWSTPATRELCAIMLPDSAQMQVRDAERARRHRAAQDVHPLYDQDDVERVLRQFSDLPYGRPQPIAEGVTLTFHDAGHILGSAIVALDIEDQGRRTRLVFSGDLGNWPVPLLRDPEVVTGADVLLLESTYGDRNHKDRVTTVEELARVVAAARNEGGKVLVPAFAVGRTQELIYHFGALERSGRLGLPVFLDSPMAVSTTRLYRHHREVLDAEALALLDRGDHPLDFDGLHLVRSTDESIALNTRRGAAVIVSASGMCTGGRIVHHLRHHAPKASTHIVIVGYQSLRTPGRALVDGARAIFLLGERVEVNAKVHTLGGFSAHADQARLMQWAGNFRDSKPRTFLVHGEHGARRALAGRLERELGYEVTSPLVGDAAEI